VTVRYRFDESYNFAGGLLQDSSVRLGIRNVFDTRPHVLPSIAAQGQGSLFARGGDANLQSYSISVEKSF
jgi:outer membrane receptor protein involved in Fe transport